MKKTHPSVSDKLLNIPRTGRIGRFAKILEKELDAQAVIGIMNGSENYRSLSPEEKAFWWKNAVERMEQLIGREKATAIMRTCGSKCCATGLRKTAEKLMSEATSVSDFLQKLEHYDVKEGELEYVLIDENTIIARHNRCFCGQVKNLKKNFENDIYCQCSVEFNKRFFQAAFNKNVDVQLKQSILSGAPHCEFEIKITDKLQLNPVS